jgi:Ulp1 protease family, C-terminal catalytic domain
VGVGSSWGIVCSTVGWWVGSVSAASTEALALGEDWAPELDPPQDTPAQHNGYDCGVFLCAITDCLFRHEPLQFTESHLPAYRELMALALLQQSAPPWSDPFLIVRSSP